MAKLDGSELDSVAATALWTLRNRAVQAAHPKSPYSDPLAVELYEAIDYDYAAFGRPSQSHPLRAMALDQAIHAHLAEHPGAPVIALGEGLLMYFQPSEAEALIADCAARFPGGRMFFDSIPPWFGNRTLKGLNLTDRYTAPPMPFSLTVSQARRHSGVLPAGRVIGVPRPRAVRPGPAEISHRHAWWHLCVRSQWTV